MRFRYRGGSYIIVQGVGVDEKPALEKDPNGSHFEVAGV
jgi:hypothetical protein